MSSLPPPPSGPPDDDRPVGSGGPWQPGGAPVGGVTAEERTWAMAAHLSALAAAFVALAFLGPLVVWLVKRDESAFVRDQAAEALNFNLSLYIYGIIGVVFGVLTLGLGFVLVAVVAAVAGVAWLVLTIVAGIKANEGVAYRYPLTLRIIT